METLAVLDSACGRLETAPGRVIIRGPEHLVYCTAADILEKARLEAARIIENAKTEAKKSRTEGFNAGREEAIASQARLIGGIAAKGEIYLADMEDKVISLVMVAIRRLVGEMDDRLRISRVVQNALSVVQRQNRVVIRVAGCMSESVRESLETILLPYPLINMAEVTPDESLDKNECVIETRAGTVKAGLNSQLAALQAAVEQTFGGRSLSVSSELRELERSVMVGLEKEPESGSGGSDV
jgi:type III secretion protein L